MNKTKIEWCDYSVNPIKGICAGGCWYCYADKMYKRFKMDETIRLDMAVFEEVWKIDLPSRIFVCSTHDLFGDWVSADWIKKILEECLKLVVKKHTFIILTKNPKRIREFEIPFNCIVGVSLDCEDMVQERKLTYDFRDSWKKENFIAMVSFEPLLGYPLFIEDLKFISWVVMGGLTGHQKSNSFTYKEELKFFGKSIIQFAEKNNIRVFAKANLHWYQELKEWPI